MHAVVHLAVVFLAAVALLRPAPLRAQCCAGGSGSCIIGGAAQGVLPEKEMEINANFQYIGTEAFFKEDRRVDERTFDRFESQYGYLRLAYGITSHFTLSLESGYYLLKKEVGLDKDPATTYRSQGFGDLVIFPRYDVLRRSNGRSSNEIALGIGYKLPLGSYNDSTGNVEPFSGQTYYVTKPTSVQLSSGAHDLLFHVFLHHGFLRSKFNVFASGQYILKGWNPNGERLGDFMSVALYGSRSIGRLVGLTVQVRYEVVKPTRILESVLLFGRPSNYFPEATGYRKLFLTPQVSFTKDRFTVYAAADVPLYQHMNSAPQYTQVGSQYTATVGLSYRFSLHRSTLPFPTVKGRYYCPMHPEENSDKPGSCTKCKMDLERAK